MRVGFSPREVIRLTGVPYSTLNLWAKNGLIVPSIADGSGSGNERIYGINDLVALRVAFELRKAGVTTRSLQKVVNFVRKNGNESKSLAHARLIVVGNDVFDVQSDHQLISALRNPGQACLSFVVDLPRTLGELSKVMDDLNAVALWTPQETSTSIPKKPSASMNEQQPQRRGRK